MNALPRLVLTLSIAPLLAGCAKWIAPENVQRSALEQTFQRIYLDPPNYAKARVSYESYEEQKRERIYEGDDFEPFMWSVYWEAREIYGQNLNSAIVPYTNPTATINFYEDGEALGLSIEYQGGKTSYWVNRYGLFTEESFSSSDGKIWEKTTYEWIV